MMSDQVSNFLQQIQDEDVICRSMLNLSTVSDHQSSSAADAYPDICACSAKRHSPASLQEPPPKRATLHPPPSSLEDHNLLGYKKLPLPPPPLRRTLSAPIYSEVPPPQLPPFSTSPQKLQDRNVAQEFPKSPPLLYRTVSDPNPAFAGAPPHPPSRRNVSRSSSLGESPNARRLRRMKERLKEMSQWANQVSIADDGDETVESENPDNNPKECAQEAVFVEKSGECLVLHFKCPCGHGYQILLSGDSCYYKLTTFPN